MTPADFTAWQTAMAYTNYRVAKLMGVSESTVANWRNGKAPISTTVSLACAALAAGLTEWAPELGGNAAQKVAQAVASP